VVCARCCGAMRCIVGARGCKSYDIRKSVGRETLRGAGSPERVECGRSRSVLPLMPLCQGANIGSGYPWSAVETTSPASGYRLSAPERSPGWRTAILMLSQAHTSHARECEAGFAGAQEIQDLPTPIFASLKDAEDHEVVAE